MDHLSIVPDMHSIPELTPTANFFWSQIFYKVSQRPKFSQSQIKRHRLYGENDPERPERHKSVFIEAGQYETMKF